MSKSKRKGKHMTTDKQDMIEQPQPQETPQANDPGRPAGLSLDQIRIQALRAQNDTAQTIARLENWRAEIDATIAFLRSQRGA